MLIDYNFVMAIKTAKVEKQLEEVQKSLLALQSNVNQEIQTLNSQIANKVFHVNKITGKIEALEENYSDLGYTAKDKDEKVETYKHNIEHGQQEIQNLQQQVENARNRGIAEAQKLEGKRELYRELLDLSD